MAEANTEGEAGATPHASSEETTSSQRHSFAIFNAVFLFAMLVFAADETEESLKFRVVWKKQTFDVSFGAEQKVAKLKEHIQTLTGPKATRAARLICALHCLTPLSRTRCHVLFLKRLEVPTPYMY